MQRSYLLLVFMIFRFPAEAQLSETFSDSNFTSNPVWIGETAFFTISPGLALQSNGPNATSQLHLSSANTRCRDTEWNFYTQLDLDITTTNWARIYLTSDRSDTENNPKGYYVKLDGTSNSIDLYRQDSTKHTKLISGKTGRAGKTSKNNFRIKVICDVRGNWHLYSDTTATGAHFEKEGSVLDTLLSSSSYCGVYFAHSATRRKKFYFDDFTIRPASLSLIAANAITAQSVEIILNHLPETNSAARPENYSFFPLDIEIQSIQQNGNKIIAYLSTPLTPSVNYTISVHDLLDTQLNPIGFLNTVSFSYRIQAAFGDVLLTEIFPDPSPVIGLPEVEYAELLNNTNDTLELQEFVFSDGSTNAFFPFYKLAPHHYLLICATNSVSYFSTNTSVLGLANFPSLNNSGDSLVLKNQKGVRLHEVNYTDLWYNDNDKKEGGWSLEIIDVTNPCGEASNWTASSDASGGTPARGNSVAASKPDLTAPQLTSASIIDSTHILLVFDEKPDTITLSPSLFGLDQNTFLQKILFPSNAQQLLLEIFPPFVNGTFYTLTFSGIKDCNGNNSFQPTSVSLLQPQEAVPGDILLNEILFNPTSGGYDFVELYNRSDHYIDLKNWQLANFEDELISNKKTLSPEALILKPKEYIAFTKNKSILLNNYPLGRSERIVQLYDLPSYNDDEGTVIILNHDQQEQDRFHYSEDFHFALIDDKEGVSLERISPNEKTNTADNWHSASSSSGYATPGYKNSESIENTKGTQVWIEPPVFTPDENGYKDYTLINYKFDTPGNMATITVFDSYGREMICLARNELLATEGFYRWDGNNTKQEKVRSGAYIVYFELFNLKGEVEKYKEVVVVD